MFAMLAASLGLVQPTLTSSRPAVGRVAAPLMATPIDAVVSPLNKWQPAAEAVAGSPLDGLPLEVKALFALIPVVGVLGLIKANGGLGGAAPTLGLGQGREELAPEAAAAAEKAAKELGKDPADLTDAEREKMYFKTINEENKKKRGGSKKKRK